LRLPQAADFGSRPDPTEDFTVTMRMNCGAVRHFNLAGLNCLYTAPPKR